MCLSLKTTKLQLSVTVKYFHLKPLFFQSCICTWFYILRILAVVEVHCYDGMSLFLFQSNGHMIFYGLRHPGNTKTM